MANIHDAKDRLTRGTLARFGQPISVMGNTYTAIIDDDEFEDDAGYRREVLASFEYSVGASFSRGNTVVFKGENYKLGRPQRENSNDNLFAWELKRV